MDILVTIPDQHSRLKTFFNDTIRDRLNDLGSVTWNSGTEPLTQDELKSLLPGKQVCITGWKSSQMTEDVLKKAEDLELIAHVGGSVAPYVSDYSYDQGITVCSANDVMAKIVAEYILGSILSSLRDIPAIDAEMKAGEWDRGPTRIDSLFETTVGFVGLGTIGEYLLDLLAPFDVEVLVYDPYISDARIADYEFVTRVNLEKVLTESSIVSIHASKTDETIHLLDEPKLELMQDDSLLINAARGSIIESEALIRELETGRISAVLDVFDQEPLPANHRLREFENVILTPHMAGSAIREPLTSTMVDEISRFKQNRALQHEIPKKQYKLMTEQ
ncbi:hydroxyacid dehydrogenase [Halocatena marina]|uniref:Hydroxyacid dehydrogenase n=2 Tax=Halocatena marina TaxID=2934937 RepID=A0ABD5YWY3_9EURY|nr:hydroxyacid dehydrogenase [Halocatena marina]